MVFYLAGRGDKITDNAQGLLSEEGEQGEEWMCEKCGSDIAECTCEAK
ncbi:hypothetical protein GOV10_06385 [Candidatus Woesearchaeota archaeon]|nr:hypothetical protein [Candidatus Woesearchaeota archaeon]